MNEADKAKFTKERDGVYINAQGRRVWDKEYFAKLATAEEESKTETKGNLKPLQPRNKKFKFENTVGKSSTDSETGGFFCDVCNCKIKDSINYLDHINGRNHLRAMGMSTKTKKATVGDVRNVLKRKRNTEEYNFDERVKQLQEQDEREKEEIQLRKKQKKEEEEREAKEAFQGIDDETAAELDLPISFGGSKKR